MAESDPVPQIVQQDATPFPEPPAKRRRVSHDSSNDEIKFEDSTEYPDGQLPEQEDALLDSDKQDETLDESLLHAGSIPLVHPQHLSSPTSGIPSPAHAASTPQDSDYYTDQASSPLPIPDPDHAPAPPPVSKLQYKPKLILRGHKRAVAAVKFSPDGKLLASCSADATAKIWDAQTGKPLHTLSGHLAGISTLDWSPDSATLATGSDDKAIRLWSTQTGRPYLRPFLGHHNYIYSVKFSPKGNILASGSYDEAVFLWDVRSRACMRALPAHGDPVSGVDFSHDGTLIVSCASDGLVRVWDVATGQCLRTFFHEDTPAVSGVLFSPNSQYIATWMLDGSVRLWDYVHHQRARCVKTYQGHVNGKFSLLGAFGAYEPKHVEEEVDPDQEMQDVQDQLAREENEDMDGAPEEEEEESRPPPGPRAFLVSGSEDGAILFWDVVSKEVLQKLPARHDGVVFGVAVQPSGRAIASCGRDKTIRIWREA